MAKQLTEDELNLRRRARRRLIGAVALMLAVVVILPMVLDREPKPAGQDIELRIPPSDKAGEFVPGVVLSTAATAVSAVVSTTVSAAVSAAVSAPAAEPVSTPVSAPLAAPLAEAVSAVVPDAAPVAAPAAVAETKLLKLSDMPVSSEAMLVQVGAFSNPDAAKQEASRLKKFGFRAYTEKVGDKTRVRVGPYADREKAEKARHLLEKHGVHPVLVSAK